MRLGSKQVSEYNVGSIDMAKVHLSLQGIFQDVDSSSFARGATASDIRKGKAYPVISYHTNRLGFVAVDFDPKDLKFPAVEEFLKLLPNAAKEQGMTVRNITPPRYNWGAFLTRMRGTDVEGVCTSFNLTKAKRAHADADDIGVLLEEAMKAFKRVEGYKNASFRSSNIGCENETPPVYIATMEAKYN